MGVRHASEGLRISAVLEKGESVLGLEGLHCGSLPAGFLDAFHCLESREKGDGEAVL